MVGELVVFFGCGEWRRWEEEKEEGDGGGLLQRVEGAEDGNRG